MAQSFRSRFDDDQRRLSLRASVRAGALKLGIIEEPDGNPYLK